jgi:CheY-like chemotaxis protein
MNGFGAFESELGNALQHLYDPDYMPSPIFFALTGCSSSGGPGPVQAVLLETIEGLKPAPEIPLGSRSHRDYDVLYHHFALKLTQEETAQALHMSVRTVQRAQREATHAMAMLLWQGSSAQTKRAAQASEPTTAVSTTAADWRSQAERELESLRESAPDRVTDVAQVLGGLLELESALTAGAGITLQVGHVQPNLVAAVHPSALRQTLIAAVRQLAGHISSGPITIYAGLLDAEVRITLTGTMDAEQEITNGDLVQSILLPKGGRIETAVEDRQVFLYIHAPSTGQVTVLAVDDNPDMLHFYRRCTAGTRYHVIQATGGREAMAHIQAHPPDIILLDVMLPDVDGWKLLMQLHEDPTTRAIPIIICSVIREEDLAYSLGAALYLSKPVQPHHLTEALDQVRPRE